MIILCSVINRCDTHDRQTGLDENGRTRNRERTTCISGDLRVVITLRSRKPIKLPKYPQTQRSAGKVHSPTREMWRCPSEDLKIRAMRRHALEIRVVVPTSMPCRKRPY